MAEIAELYHDPKQGFTNAQDIFTKLRDRGVDYSFKQVKEYLDGEEGYQRHKPEKKSVYRITAYFKDDKWQADLIDISKYHAVNRHYNFLLTVIDVLTKYAWVVALKDKTEDSVRAGFELVFQSEEAPRPSRLKTDNGTEFKNKKVKALMDELGINHQFNQPDDHHAQGVIERFNQTLMKRVAKYMSAYDTHSFIDHIDDLVYNYNHTKHSTIKMTPAQARITPPDPIVNENVSSESFPEIGDNVRKLLKRDIYTKGYLPTWSKEVYKIDGREGQYYRLNGDSGLYKYNQLQVVGQEPEQPKPAAPKPPVTRAASKAAESSSRVSTRGGPRKDYKAMNEGLY